MNDPRPMLDSMQADKDIKPNLRASAKALLWELTRRDDTLAAITRLDYGIDTLTLSEQLFHLERDAWKLIAKC